MHQPALFAMDGSSFRHVLYHRHASFAMERQGHLILYSRELTMRQCEFNRLLSTHASEAVARKRPWQLAHPVSPLASFFQ